MGTGGILFMTPSGNVAKGTVIRAAAFRNGNIIPESITSGSFFVFPNGSPYRSLPLVSIIVDSLNFFGHDRGIYVPGANFRNDDATGNYYMRGDDWEREGYFEYFNTSGNTVVSQNVGYRINGGWTRRFPQKSLRIYARRRYDKETLDFRGGLFHYAPDTSFKRLLLRSGGNDVQVTLIRDASAQYMLSHAKTFDTQAFRSVVVFLNGEFWGWHNIRERLDKHYLERTYGVDPDNIDLLNFSYSSTRGSVRISASEGDSAAYFRMFAYSKEVNDNPTDKAVLDSMLKLIDIDSYLDYYAVTMLLGNWDGIYNNHRMWRERRSFHRQAPVGRDGRFRWYVFDLDQIMNIWNGGSHIQVNGHSFDDIFSSSNPGNELFRNLMRNESIRHHFINSFANLLNSAFYPGRSDAVIDSIVKTMEPIMVPHIRRWRNPINWREDLSQEGRDITEDFRGEVSRLKSNYRGRIRDYRETVRDYHRFNAGPDRNVTLISDTTRGFIKINSMVVDPRLPRASDQASWNGSKFSWSGIYFRDVPITLSGVGKRNYRIEKWIVRENRHNAESVDSVITVRLSENYPDETMPICSQDCTIEAIFVYDSLYFVGTANNIISRKASNISINHRVHSRSNVTFNFTLP